MNEYISRKAAIDAIFDYFDKTEETDTIGDTNLRDVLMEVPAAEVRPAKTACWARMSEQEVMGEINCQCSECAYDDWNTPSWWNIWANYCPNCGSYMRGGNSDD